MRFRVFLWIRSAVLFGLVIINSSLTAQTITQQPVSKSVYVGEEVSFSATFSGVTKSFSFDWYKDDDITSVGNSRTLTISNVDADDQGFYRLEYTTGAGVTSYSDYVWLSVLSANETSALSESDELELDIFFEGGTNPRSNNVYDVVAIDDNLVCISDITNDVIDIYKFKRGGLSKITSLNPPSGLTGTDSFGSSIDIHGNYIAVGVPDYESASGSDGVVVLYRMTSENPYTWVADTTLEQTASNSAKFGFEVALDGDLLAVGDPFVDGIVGLITIYKLDANGDWSSIGTIEQDYPESFDYFGRSIALSERELLVGAFNDDYGALSSAGSAYLYEDRDGDNVWILEDTLRAGVNASDTDIFGIDVSLHEGVAVVGSYLDDTEGTDSGSAYIFEDTDSDGEWELVNQLSGNNEAGAGFGLSVALDEGSLLVGEYGSKSTESEVFLYLKDADEDGTDDWTLHKRFSSGETGDFFGYSLALSGGNATVVAPRGDNSLTYEGKIYTYSPGATLTGVAGWRMLASYVDTLTYNTLLDTLWTQGVTGSDYPDGDATIYTYSAGQSDFTAVSSMNSAPGAGTGFLVYAFADHDFDGADEGFPVLLPFSGFEPSGDQSLSINTTSDSYTLVGNPFASGLLVSQLSSDNTNVNSTYQIWDPNDSGGAWQLSGVDFDTVGTGQSFIIQNASSSPATSFSIGTSAKAFGAPDGAYSKTNSKEKEDSYLRLILHSEYEVLDKANVVRFMEEAEVTSDRWSASKLVPLKANWAVLMNNQEGEPLSQLALPAHLNQPHKIPYSVVLNGFSGAFLIFAEAVNLPDGMQFFLTDTETGARVNILEQSYEFFEESHEKPTTSIAKPEIRRLKQKQKNRFVLEVIPSLTNNTEQVLSPSEFKLLQNYPNPFNPSTTISFSIPEATKVSISVYNAMGRKITQLFDGIKASGQHSVDWNANTHSSGVYYYRIRTDFGVITKPMLLLK